MTVSLPEALVWLLGVWVVGLFMGSILTMIGFRIADSGRKPPQ